MVVAISTMAVEITAQTVIASVGTSLAGIILVAADIEECTEAVESMAACIAARTHFGIKSTSGVVGSKLVASAFLGKN
jgi:hypothetical protein